MAPCQYCERNQRKCIKAEESSARCNECVRRGSRCDTAGPSLSDWESLDRQQERLDQEEEEAMAKILRLRKQKALLRKRGKEMLRRGLKTLDEFDELEREKQEASAPSSSVESDPTVSFVPTSDVLSLSTSEWDQWLQSADVSTSSIDPGS